MFFVVFASCLCQSEDKGNYRVGIGDILEITVVGHNDLDSTVAVAPDGTISFPLIGTVEVKGKPITEINSLIENTLKDGYIKYPQVATSLKESKSKKFYIYGEVVSPGSYQYTDDVTVLKAVTMAGGLTRFGSESNIKILKSNGGAKGYEITRVNLKDITRGGDKAKDVVIEPGDVIIVSE
jgi:polysaccharide export outer membrane protein